MAIDFDPKRVEKAWARFIDKATDVHAPFTTYLNQGATRNQIDLAERAVNCEFPPDLRQLLSLHNGSRRYFVLPRWELFSTELIVDAWKMWEDLYLWQSKSENITNFCEPSGPIKDDEWWRLRWIPFCGDHAGNHLCVDMDPAEGGNSGQVITMWHDDARRELIAKSLTEYIEIIASDFERGALIWHEELGVYESEILRRVYKSG
jgi:cell wall assembly regulator SMI1